ncbi:MAG: phosphoribosyltransferase [Epsilonproteobacteria bacterium]|nr:phosphoribosyltransferase [Campylobacterota bacterium]NPA89096.1 phosphoribosyltransferase [Campylobacterota bacterium]
MIKDRISAGEALADRIEKLGLANPVVVALPRGGVAVGVPIAKRLNAPLDLLFIKKIPAPGNPELALGSVAESGLLHLNQKLAVKLGVTEEYVQQVGREKIAEIARQREKYQWEPVPLEGKDVIIVDDGIATGSSAYLALQSVVREYPKSITLAVPVAPEDPDLFKVLNSLTHNLIILETHSPFIAVGKWYEDFHQLGDGEVKGLLSQLQ